MFNELLVGPQNVSGGALKARGGHRGETLVSHLQGKFYELCYRGELFQAHAIVTAPVIYTTAAGTGGPLFWNNSTTKNIVLLAVGFGVTTVTTVAAALGITGGVGQTAAPTTATAIDSNRNLLIGGALPVTSVYRIGTVANAGNFLLPFGHLHTGGLTVDNFGITWVELGGCVIVPPNAWASVAASATASTTVASIGVLYTEQPV